jgi:YegS/Rv2252/BmrU family lipid kinase
LPSTRGALFFNPSSGKKLGEDTLRELKDAAAAAGLEAIELTREIDCVAVVRERIQRGLRIFVAAGGDGTVNNIVQALVNTDAVLGVIPVGTYNHFARDLDMPLEWKEALDVILNGRTQQVDVGRVNERYFVNNLSIGLYPELVAKREEKGRDYPRWKARLFAAYATLRKYPHVTLMIDSAHHHELVRTHVFMVSNNSYDLSRIGIEAGRASMDEGRLSVYWLPHLPRVALMRFVARYLAGRVKETPGFRSFRTAHMRVQSRRSTIRVGIDGELFNLTTPLAITIAPQSLNVRVPLEKK